MWRRLCLIKVEQYPKIKFSPVVVLGVLNQGPRKLRRFFSPLFPIELATFTKTGWLRPTRWGFVCKMSLKAPFRSYRMSAPLKPWPYIRNTAAFLDILDAKWLTHYAMPLKSKSTQKFQSKSTCSPFLLGCRFVSIVLIPSFLRNLLQMPSHLWSPWL